MLVETNGKYYYKGGEITEDEYQKIMGIMHDKPQAPAGHSYRLRDDLTWELYVLPPVEADPPTTEEQLAEAQEALQILTGKEITT